MERRVTLSIGSIVGCNSMVFSKVNVVFRLKKDGSCYVENMEELPFHVKKALDWNVICESVNEKYRGI